MSRFLLVPLLLCVCPLHAAANVTQIHRYATVDNKPLAAQINPLLTVQHIHFPQDIKTVGQAMDFWVHYSGFMLAAAEQQPQGLQTVRKQSLPHIHRNLGPLTVKEGLEVLAGQQVFRLTENPLTREVLFTLKPAYQVSVRSKP